jgi:hypothetical protein
MGRSLRLRLVLLLALACCGTCLGCHRKDFSPVLVEPRLESFGQGVLYPIDNLSVGITLAGLRGHSKTTSTGSGPIKIVSGGQTGAAGRHWRGAEPAAFQPADLDLLCYCTVEGGTAGGDLRGSASADFIFHGRFANCKCTASESLIAASTSSGDSIKGRN